MRTFIYLIFAAGLAIGCDKVKGSFSFGKISTDTIYGGDFIWREKAESKRTTVLFDNGKDHKKPIVKLKEENLLRIRVAGLFEFEVIPSEIRDAEIVRVDTSTNLFLVTPTDSSFSFVINQYYPKGRVIRCVRNWNDKIKDYEEYFTRLNGFNTVTHFEYKVK